MSDELGSRWAIYQQNGFREIPPAEAFNAYMKALLICANGDGRLTQKERDWVSGFCSAIGGPRSLVEELRIYPADEDIIAVLSTHEMVHQTSTRSLVFDAIRACAADGELAADEVNTIYKMAGRLNISSDTVAQLLAQHHQEELIRRKRLELVFPGGLPF